MTEHHTLTFLYQLGERVHWAAGGEAWAVAWQVLQQRCTISMITQFREYLLIAVTDTGHAPVWAHEADILPWEAHQP